MGQTWGSSPAQGGPRDGDLAPLPHRADSGWTDPSCHPLGPSRTALPQEVLCIAIVVIILCLLGPPGLAGSPTFIPTAFTS